MTTTTYYFYALRASWSKDVLSALICEEIFIKYISCTSKTKKQTTLQKWKLIYTSYFVVLKTKSRLTFLVAQSAAHRSPVFLTGMNVTCSQLLFVFAASELSTFGPLLHHHVALLNSTSTERRTFCPSSPWLQPTNWGEKKKSFDQV